MPRFLRWPTRNQPTRLLPALVLPVLTLAVLVLAASWTSPVSAESIVVKTPLVRLIQRVELSPRVEGVLKSLDVHEGQRVEAGQVLAVVEDAPAEVAHERALLEVEIARMKAENDVEVRDAEAVLQVAEAEWQRAQDTVARVAGSISQSKLDTTRLAAEKARLAVERTRRELELNKASLRVKENLAAEAQETWERHKIVSPIAGVVAAVERRVGEAVVPGEWMIRVVNDEQLRVEGFLETSQYRPGLIGAAASLQFDFPSLPTQTVPGRVVFVNPENDPHNGEIRVWIEFDNPRSAVRAGMKPRVRIDALAAPQVAPQRTPQAVPR